MALGLNVDNCPICGAIYDRNLRNMCPACSKKLNDTLDACDRFMSRNPKATTEQLHKGTGIQLDTLESFIKDKKLGIASYPNLTYPCERCGRGIRESRICFHCASSFRDAFQPQKPTGPIRAAGTGFQTGDRHGR